MGTRILRRYSTQKLIDETQSYTVRFHQKNAETIPLTYMFGKRYQQVEKWAMSKQCTCKLFVGKLERAS